MSPVTGAPAPGRLRTTPAIAARRRRVGRGLVRPGLVDPGIEKPPLGRFEIVADDDADILPAPSRQRETTQGRRLDADEQRQQQADRDNHPRRGTDQTQSDLERHGHDDVADQYQPQPMPQHPQRRQQEGPEREAVAHESETIGIGRGCIRLQRRLVHGVDGHRSFTFSSLAGTDVSRRASPWSTGFRWPHAHRWRAPHAKPAPEP